MGKLVYPQLSYKIVGLLFEVHNRLGGNFEEKYYQRALEKLFKLNEENPAVKELIRLYDTLLFQHNENHFSKKVIVKTPAETE